MQPSVEWMDPAKIIVLQMAAMMVVGALMKQHKEVREGFTVEVRIGRHSADRPKEMYLLECSGWNEVNSEIRTICCCFKKAGFERGFHIDKVNLFLPQIVEKLCWMKCQQEIFRAQKGLRNPLALPPSFINENIEVWSGRGSCVGSSQLSGGRTGT